MTPPPPFRNLLGSIQKAELPVLFPHEVLGMERGLPLQVHAHHTVPCRGVTSVLARAPPPPRMKTIASLKGLGHEIEFKFFDKNE
jgi:hypothetical protein